MYLLYIGYLIILSSISGPVATALLLVFKAQRLHHSPNLLPHPQVIVQLCATAGDSLNTCQQSMGNEDELNLVRDIHSKYLVVYYLSSSPTA